MILINNSLSSCYLKFSCTKYFLNKHNGYIQTKTEAQGKL